jgi:hypothetical protein
MLSFLIFSFVDDSSPPLPPQPASEKASITVITARISAVTLFFIITPP